MTATVARFAVRAKPPRGGLAWRMKIVRLQPDAAVSGGEHYYVAPEKLLAGNPRQTAWVHYSDPGGRFSAGYWRSEPGKWRIAYTEEEYCQILEGVSIITDDAGETVRLGPGDCFVVPRGFSGSWEVVTTTRKIFVIYEAGS
jgi:uncharacterized cupin superfamily protein